MKQNIVALFDKKVLAYARPVFVPAIGAVVRDIGDQVNAGQEVFAKHASDFELYDFGTFDDSTGVFDLHAKPVMVLNLESLKSPAV